MLNEIGFYEASSESDAQYVLHPLLPQVLPALGVLHRLRMRLGPNGEMDVLLEQVFGNGSLGQIAQGARTLRTPGAPLLHVFMGASYADGSTEVEINAFRLRNVLANVPQFRLE